MAQSAALDKIETVARAIEFLVQLTDEDVRSPEDALVEACALAERLEPNAIVGYTTTDSRSHVATFQTAVYPRLPTWPFSKLHDVPITRPYAGTCVQAICEGRTITCSDRQIGRAGWSRCANERHRASVLMLDRWSQNLGC
jgi:hypothetical protein